MTAPATEPRKGLSVDILTPPGMNCSANGISARFPGAVIVDVRTRDGSLDAHRAVAAGLKVMPSLRVFPANENSAEVELVVRFLFDREIYIHAEPTEGGGRQAMFGGAYITTSDSRFSSILRAIYATGERTRIQVGPIPLHDRYEGRR